MINFVMFTVLKTTYINFYNLLVNHKSNNHLLQQGKSIEEEKERIKILTELNY